MPTKTSSKSASSSLSSGKAATRKPSDKSTSAAVKGAQHKSRLDAPAEAAKKKSTKNINTTPNQARQDLDIEYFRGLLLSERARLEEEREQIRGSMLDVDGALPDEGEGAEEDTADLASAMMDKEMNLSVEDEIEDLLATVDHALQKMDDGTYGICDISGEPIPTSRLEIIPWAALTVECQALSEE